MELHGPPAFEKIVAVVSAGLLRSPMQRFSLTVAKIEMFRKDGSNLMLGAIGTAFFYKLNNDSFLVTNWHNVTGINPATGKALHTRGLLPNMIRTHYKQWANAAKSVLKSQHIDISLYHNGEPVWLEHSNRGGVDVVVIPIQLSDFENFANEYINTVDQEAGLETYAGMDCFILGFPENLIGAANTPIWKRGSIASEPYKDYPYYIDSATRKGMSGAPVIARHTGIFGMGGGKLTGNEIIGTVEKFIAIYSGRVGNDALGFQLGTAWQSNVLDDILTARLPGKHPLIVSA